MVAVQVTQISPFLTLSIFMMYIVFRVEGQNMNLSCVFSATVIATSHGS